MFLKTALGPKEGRLPPGSLFSPLSLERRRRLSGRQKNAVIFSIVLLVFLIYTVWPHLQTLERVEGHKGVSHGVPTWPNLESPISSGDASEQGDRRVQFGSRKSVRPSWSQKPMVDKTTNDKKNLKEPTNKGSTTHDTEKQKVQYHTSKPGSEKKKPHPNHWPERPDLRDDLDAIFALIPDEMNMREFLRPIDNGGPERMRELGLRTRAYKKYLSAWEKLHMGEDMETGETYIRDDVIQYLRGIENDEETGVGSSLTNTIHNYDAFRSFLAKFAHVLFPFTSPYFADHMTLRAGFKNAGRGIVLTAGDDQAKYLLTTIYTFRELGCDLPIEVMYLGDEDLGEDHRFELEVSLFSTQRLTKLCVLTKSSQALPGVTTRDISVMVDDKGWKLAGWAIKPYAMLMSSFREVIFIDADSFFFRDPAQLFDDPDYQKTGALFFRDRTIMPESKRRLLLQVLPRPIHKLAKESSWWKGTSGHHQESGVVVVSSSRATPLFVANDQRFIHTVELTYLSQVDKWRHFYSMLLICRFNGSDRDTRDGNLGVYELMHGE